MHWACSLTKGRPLLFTPIDPGSLLLLVRNWPLRAVQAYTLMVTDDASWESGLEILLRLFAVSLAAKAVILRLTLQPLGGC